VGNEHISAANFRVGHLTAFLMKFEQVSVTAVAERRFLENKMLHFKIR
jgi:hypothetical protein